MQFLRTPTVPGTAALGRRRADRTCRKLLYRHLGRPFRHRFASSRTGFGPAVALRTITFRGPPWAAAARARRGRGRDKRLNLGAVGFVMESRTNRTEAREIAMARIHCTIVESSDMATGFEIGCDPQVTPTPAGDWSQQRGRFESRLEPVYCDLLPWADPYIASLVRDLQLATGAMLPHGWPRGTAPESGSPSRSRDQRWPERFRPDGGK